MKLQTGTFALILLIAFGLSSCKEKDNNDQAALDKQKIEAYLAENGLEAMSTPSGLHYIILNASDNQRPTLNSRVSVAYKGYLLDNTVFDQSDLIDFQLGQVIRGWQEGIQLIGEGGNITLFVPSHLGYGSQQTGPIPANSVLVFEVSLFSFS
jgi:FKBP-type peptidyl-prolyl cis-trans isomerase FkpA